MPAKTQRYYVGQSRKLKQRMADHMDFRYREKNPSLHYYALQRSKSDYFVTLSHVPDADTCERLGIQGDRGKDSYLFLDLLETWCCLMFQTLPEKYLNDFLPHDMPRQGNRGLNLQLPLRNLRKSGFDWPEIRDIWNESSDPLHEEYYSWRSLKFHYSTKEVAEHRERGLEICKKLDGMTSTPLRLTMPSPPATGSNPAYGRLQSEASKQPLSSTPSRTRSSTTSGGNSRGSILVDTGVSKIDRSGHRKRKRNAHSLSGGENLTGRSTIRNLESYFKNAAKP
jgi:hypothetical protein